MFALASTLTACRHRKRRDFSRKRANNTQGHLLSCELQCCADNSDWKTWLAFRAKRFSSVHAVDFAFCKEVNGRLIFTAQQEQQLLLLHPPQQ